MAKQIDCGIGRRSEMYALRFEGYLEAPDTGYYLFAARADDAARIWIDGKRVTDVAHLQAGHHRLAVDYVQGRHGRRLEVHWRRPGTSSDVALPPAALSHARPAEER